ncbi:MAG: sensor histidine kinase, partial [Actinomycetota bacterium]|nr:sensor histidine kinase [Actinomycetota bacterium]
VGLACIVLSVLGGQIISISRGNSIDFFEVGVLAFPIVGALIVSRQPNAIGWIMLGIGVGEGLSTLVGLYAVYSLDIHPGSLPQPGIALAFGEGDWVPLIGLVGTFLILLFPDGHLPSPRWKPWAWLCATTMILIYILITVSPGSFADQGYPGIRNPLGIEALKPLIGPAYAVIALLPVSIVGCAVALTRRFRRSRGQERLQMKWFTATAGLLAVSYLILMALNLPFLLTNRPTPHWIDIVGNIGIAPFVLIPLAVGIAILKYRLYDIDVVINKTVVFATLAGFITLVYVAVVVGLGALIGSGGKPNLGLSILATAIVAVAFQPVRERVQHFANRLVYGKRATPYEVLAEFSAKVAETYATEDVLPKMARTVAEGTGAAHAEVWLRSGTELRRAGSWPEGAGTGSTPRFVADGQLPDFGAVDRAIAVRHQGTLLGAMTVTKPAGEPLTPGEEKLLNDLASQAGLVLRNVGLTSELLQRLDELKASRQRLVAAQDETRRRLERDLHDGAQRQLVAVKERLALARTAARRDPEETKELLAAVKAEAGDALEALRELARGIYPPLLADKGLLPALQAQARKVPVDVEVQGENIARYPEDIEAAVYFCCLEALQNVAKYANATCATVTLEQRAGELAFSVGDDGVGFDPTTTPKGSGTQNMADRIEALGGSLTVASIAGNGTTVSARLPVKSLEPVA